MATMMQCSMHGLPSSSPAFAGTKSQLGLPALTKLQGLPSFGRGRGKGRPLNVQASAKKIKVDEPYGPCGNTNFKDGKDASGRLAKGKGVYQFANKYGANVDGYSPIYDPKDWSASGDVYTGGRTGLIIWAVTLGGLLAVGAFLVYNTSALSG